MSNEEAPRGAMGVERAILARALVTVRGTFDHLRTAGLSVDEAGNLTAKLHGLRVAEQSWTVREVERLMFIRALVDLRRIGS